MPAAARRWLRIGKVSRARCSARLSRLRIALRVGSASADRERDLGEIERPQAVYEPAERFAGEVVRLHPRWEPGDPNHRSLRRELVAGSIGSTLSCLVAIEE